MNITNITRQKYLDRLIPLIDQPIIKVITGQRRVGKSYLMLQLMEFLKQSRKKAHIIYINKEDYAFDHLHDYHDLIRYLKKTATPHSKTYLFIDEVQEIKDFQKAIRSFAKSGKYDIYLTGSNSELLSSDLAGKLSGRYLEIRVHPLSFPEFLVFHQLPQTSASLEQYIRYGGLPYLVNLQLNDEQVYGYLQNVYDTVILKDVVKRFSIRNLNFLERLLEYLADNLGSQLSAKKISDFLKSQHINLAPNTVLNYLSYTTSSYFLTKTRRLDVIGKKIFEIGEKYYFEDLGMRHVLINYKQMDINKILENLVYTKLVDAGYTVYVGQLGQTEIDFVGERAGNRLYVQVAYLLSSPKVIKREFGNLLAIPDNYPKYVVTMDTMASGNTKGVTHLHILDFLTKSDL